MAILSLRGRKAVVAIQSIFWRIVRRGSMVGLSCALLAACSQKPTDAHHLRVGVIAGPEATLVEVAAKQAKRAGLILQIVQFSDYNLPNAALADGSLDANIFQHKPYLEEQMKEHHYPLVAIGRTFVYPMGIYSKRIHTLSGMPVGARIAVPNDPTNEARALLLLEHGGLIVLKSGVGTNATVRYIDMNPRHLRIVELDAAQLPRVLNDVAAAVINTNYAVPAGLSPNQAIYREGSDSQYANLVVVRDGTEDDPRFGILLRALHSQAVVQKADVLFGPGGAIPAW